MNIKFFILCCLLGLSYQSFAQPVYSPEVRAKNEVSWMKDSLALPQDKLDKISKISLDYNQNMDKASELPGKAKAQQKLMKKKDAAIKVLLDKTQYQKYCKKEKMIRDRGKIIYKGNRQPY